MKKIILVLIASVFVLQLSGIAFCDEMKTEKKGPDFSQKWSDRKIDKLVKELKLTPEQRAKISELIKDTSEDITEITQKMTDKVKALQEKFEKKLKGIMTDEQAQKYEKAKAAKKAKKAPKAEAK